MDYSEAKLNELGYRQDLRRALSQFGSLAVALSVGSVLSALTCKLLLSPLGFATAVRSLQLWHANPRLRLYLLSGAQRLTYPVDHGAASFSIGYSHGGPALLVWSWLLHTLLGLCCWLSLAELCSSIPTAGSMFTWNYFLAGRYRRFWCWITGTVPFAILQSLPPAGLPGRTVTACTSKPKPSSRQTA